MNWYFTGDKQLAPVLEKLALEGIFQNKLFILGSVATLGFCWILPGSVTQLLSVWVEVGELTVRVLQLPGPCV